MIPILINEVFAYVARILTLLVLLWLGGACLRQLFKSHQLAQSAAPKWQYVLAATGVIALNDPSNGDALAALSKMMGPWGTTARRGSATGALIGILIGSTLALPLFLRPGSVLDDIRWFELVIIMTLILAMISSTAGLTIGQLRGESRMALVPERSTGYNPLLRGHVSDFRATILLAAPILLWLTTGTLAISAAIGLIQPYMSWENLPSEQRPLPFALPLISALGLCIIQLVSRAGRRSPARIYLSGDDVAGSRLYYSSHQHQRTLPNATEYLRYCALWPMAHTVAPQSIVW